MRLDAQHWFATRTLRAVDLPDAAALVPRKAGQRISVVLPALNEAATVGPIVAAVRRELVDRVPLVDELVVMDPGSTDDTARIAAAAGAVVVREADVLPQWGSARGKGEALWKSLHATTGDLVVWVDADIEGFDPGFVTGLVAPLLLDPVTQLVKACYDRPLRADGTMQATGGGRVTELVARPLLDLHFPALAGVVQPLSGEYAGRRALLERLPFVTGYGVEIALLVDALREVGLDGLAQVDLGRRVHRNQGDAALGRMAAAILRTVEMRLGRPADGGQLVQFARGADGRYAPQESDVVVEERPPMCTVDEYAARHAGRLAERAG